MAYTKRWKFALAAIVPVMMFAPPASLRAQSDPVPNSQPNPYRTIEDWAKLPEGRTWGSAAGVAVDRNDNIWVAANQADEVVVPNCGSEATRRFTRCLEISRLDLESSFQEVEE